jgi:hypothetical protein
MVTRETKRLLAVALGAALTLGATTALASPGGGGGGGGGAGSGTRGAGTSGGGVGPAQSYLDEIQRERQRTQADLDENRRNIERQNGAGGTRTRPRAEPARPRPHYPPGAPRPAWYVEFTPGPQPAVPGGYTGWTVLHNGYRVFWGYPDGTVVVHGPRGEDLRRFRPPLPIAR